MPAKVKVYTMSYCPFCESAKKLLKARGIEFEEIKVAEDDDAEWDRLFKLTGMKTMPQIFYGEKLIGGYDSLSALDRKNNLDSLKS
jgi:glutaredoxin 3